MAFEISSVIASHQNKKTKFNITEYRKNYLSKSQCICTTGRTCSHHFATTMTACKLRLVLECPICIDVAESPFIWVYSCGHAVCSLCFLSNLTILAQEKTSISPSARTLTRSQNSTYVNNVVCCTCRASNCYVVQLAENDNTDVVLGLKNFKSWMGNHSDDINRYILKSSINTMDVDNFDCSSECVKRKIIKRTPKVPTARVRKSERLQTTENIATQPIVIDSDDDEEEEVEVERQHQDPTFTYRLDRSKQFTYVESESKTEPQVSPTGFALYATELSKHVAKQGVRLDALLQKSHIVNEVPKTSTIRGGRKELHPYKNGQCIYVVATKGSFLGLAIEDADTNIAKPVSGAPLRRGETVCIRVFTQFQKVEVSEECQMYNG